MTAKRADVFLVTLFILLFVFRQDLFLRMVGRSYVEFVRNLPPLVLIYLFYFFAADQIMALIGVDEFVRGLSGAGQGVLAFLFTEPHLFVPFLAGIITLAFFVGAYITEIVRAGIQAIFRGQTEAAMSLGLKPGLVLTLIILPQALIALPVAQILTKPLAESWSIWAERVAPILPGEGQVDLEARVGQGLFHGVGHQVAQRRLLLAQRVAQLGGELGDDGAVFAVHHLFERIDECLQPGVGFGDLVVDGHQVPAIVDDAVGVIVDDQVKA